MENIKEFQTRIQNKVDSQTNWESINPVLLEGEIAISIMSDGARQIKIGDGKTEYNELRFLSAASGTQGSGTQVTIRTWSAEAGES